MAFRLPQDLPSRRRSAQEPSPFEVEVAAEKAAALGRAGRAVEKALARLRDAEGREDRASRLQEAADALYAFLVQRELCGLRIHAPVLAELGVPREVFVRIGARPRAEAAVEDEDDHDA